MPTCSISSPQFRLGKQNTTQNCQAHFFNINYYLSIVVVFNLGLSYKEVKMALRKLKICKILVFFCTNTDFNTFEYEVCTIIKDNISNLI